MKTAPITPATIAFDAEGVPRAPAFGDRYHARAGAAAQAEHVFLRGNGLPERWRGRQRFVILETGFGLGHNFLATWEAWRRDSGRCARLHFISVEKHPPRMEDLTRVHERGAGTNFPPALGEALRAAWPPLTGDLHRLSFEDGRVELLLALGDAATWLRRLQLQADALYLDGFAPEHNPQMWSEALFAALPALCAPGATAATWSVARAVQEGLAAQGFEVERAPGFAGKREMTVARFAPRHRPQRHARRQAARPEARTALVVGAGLAGAATAHALAAQGLEVTVLEASAAPASGASGNAAGLVRSIVTRDDGAHARWHRAAALEAQRQLTPLVRAGLVAGRLQGLLHLGDDLEDMRRRLAALPLPADHVQALDAVQATALAGLVQAGHVAATDAPGAGANLGPAWFFPAGGWVDPRTLVQHWLEHSKATLRLNCLTTQLQRHGGRWQACGPAGEIWAEADVVVLANAHGAASLAPAGCTSAWVLGRTRGQITRLSAAELSQCGLPHAPLLPLARNGYVIPLPDGSVLCGATQAADDDETGLRDGDHAHNLAVLRRLTGQGRTARDPAKDGPCAAPAMAALEGRVGWRCHSDDRLPLVGALPAGEAYSPTHPGRRLAATRLDQPRHVPREPGLFTLTALGSRGITHAALAAQVLAAWIVDAPMPIDTDLLDAVDAARPVSRATRKTQGR